jgi:hypothetical protein
MLYISKYILAKLYTLSRDIVVVVLRSIVSGFYMRTRGPELR